MTSQEKWIALFEQVAGRKPSPMEFKAGKESGFASDSIHRIVGLEESSVPIATVEATKGEESAENQVTQVIYDVAEEDFDQEDSLEDSLSEDSKEALQEAEGDDIIYDVSDETYAEAKETSFASNEQSQLLTPMRDHSNEVNAVSQHASQATDAQVEMHSTQAQHIGSVKSLKEKQADWIAAFEKFVGRKPSPKEFKAGKESSFDLRIINQFLGQTSKKAGKPLTDKKRYLYIAGGVLATVTLCAYLIGNHYYSRESVATRYLETSGKLDKQLEYEVWSDSQKPIKESEVSYWKKSKSPKPELVDLISGNTMVEVGRKWLVFPDWKVAVQPADTTISTNTKDMTITINDKQWEKSDSNHFSKTVRLYPGDYHFSLTGKLDDQEVSTSSKQTLKGDEHVALDIAYLSFTVNSNLADGDLYIGSKKITRLSNGKADVSNLAVTKNAKISVQKTFEDASKATSNTYLIKDIEDGDSVTLDAKGVLDRDTADQLLTAAYRKLDAYEDNHTTPDGLTDVFQGGATNSMYKDVVNMIETNTTNAKNRPAESISFDDIDVTNVKQVSAKKYVVDFTVVNSFYYAYDSKFKNSGYYDDKTAWSVTVDYVGKKDQSDESNSYFSDYRITGKASDSKLINRKDTVN